MLIHITSILNTSYFERESPPIMMRDPYICSETPMGIVLNEEENNEIKIDDIKTIIIFPDPFFMEICSITSDSIAKSLKVIVINTEDDKEITAPFLQSSKSDELTFYNPFHFVIECNEKNLPGQYEILLQSAVLATDNPLISFLQKNPKHTFKLKFFFYVSVVEDVFSGDVIKVLNEVESELLSLMSPLEKIQKLRTMADGQNKIIIETCSEWITVENQIVNEINDIPLTIMCENHKNQIISYLDFLMNNLETTVCLKISKDRQKRRTYNKSKKLLDENLLKTTTENTTRERCIKARIEFYKEDAQKTQNFLSVLKEILTQKVLSAIEKLDRSKSYREKIYKIFINDNHGPGHKNINLIAMLIKEIKEKRIDYDPVILVSKLYKLNPKTNKLERVAEKDNKQDPLCLKSTTLIKN
ncbi:hypothetical protein CDIK_3361 [Cucumispora dikerogammari]|nr:hypothetical protein CDIK_3361 [Cucumispora dikerogammari]